MTTELNLSISFQFQPATVEKAFRDAQRKRFVWCLPGKDVELHISPRFDPDPAKGLIKKGEDLKNDVHAARDLVDRKLVASWPYFINQAYLKEDIKDDAASHPKDNAWGKGEEQAVRFLTAVTGKPYQIDGGYEANNTMVNKVLSVKQYSVSLLLPVQIHSLFG